MRDLDSAVDGPDLVDGLDLGAEASMHTENLAVDDCANGQIVKDLSAVFPGVRIAVLPVDFIVEAINSGNLAV
jgi:hypothetical protein